MLPCDLKVFENVEKEYNMIQSIENNKIKGNLIDEIRSDSTKCEMIPNKIQEKKNDKKEKTPKKGK